MHVQRLEWQNHLTKRQTAQTCGTKTGATGFSLVVGSTGKIMGISWGITSRAQQPWRFWEFTHRIVTGDRQLPWLLGSPIYDWVNFSQFQRQKNKWNDPPSAAKQKARYNGMVIHHRPSTGILKKKNMRSKLIPTKMDGHPPIWAYNPPCDI